MSYEPIAEKPTKARIEHQCIWCGEMIFPGETYIRRAYKFEGDFHNDEVHPECFKAMNGAENIEDGFQPYGYQRGTELEK